jgi:tetratricopeptide (TPR) repeat protein
MDPNSTNSGGKRMRTRAALLLYVSVLAAAAAQRSGNVWLAKHESGLAAMDERRFGDAAQAFQDCWSISQTSMQRGIAANDAGIALRRLGRQTEAAMWLERSLKEWSAENDRFAHTSRALYGAYRDMGDYVAGERVLRVAISLNSEPAIHITLETDLGDLLREQGRAAEARPFFEAAMAGTPEASETRVYALLGLSDLDRQQQNWDSSVKRATDATELARRINARELEGVALRALGNAWLDSGNLAEAEPTLRRSLNVLENLEKPQPEQMSDVLASLGFLYRMENKPGIAEDALTRALDMKRSVMGPTHPQVTPILAMLADVWSQTGDHQKAETSAQQCVQILVDRFGERSFAVAVALSNAAEIELRAGNTDAAADRYGHALRIFRGLGADRSVVMVRVIDRYAALLKRMHRGRDAKLLLSEARTIRATAVAGQSFRGK